MASTVRQYIPNTEHSLVISITTASDPMADPDLSLLLLDRTKNDERRPLPVRYTERQTVSIPFIDSALEVPIFEILTLTGNLAEMLS